MDATFDPAGEQTWHKVGAELRRLRTGRGMSLAELARQVHYTKGYLSKIETGQKRITLEIAHLADEVLETGGVLVGLLPSSECLAPSDDELDSTGTEVCPYPGLVAFGLREACWFFGRSQATSYVVGRLDDQLAGSGPLAVVAPSGAGKSSLLAAGVIPALARGALPGSRAWPVVVTTPGAHPLATLADRVAAVTGADPAESAEATVDPQRFAAFLTATVAAHAGKQQETSRSPRIVLIVDQFEETFTECQKETERQAFITALCTAAHSAAVLVVLGVRADFYGRCLAYPALLSALQTPVALGPMSTEQLRSIITGPAAAEGLQVEPGLIELLLRDLGVTDHPEIGVSGYDPGALPLLAHALRATWQQRNGRLLTVAGYQHTGGIREAIATTAERAYTRLTPPEQQIAQQLLLRLVQVSTHTGALRRRVPRERLLQALPAPTEITEKILETFARARLLTFDTTNVEITHEALLRAWPRLTDWITADHDGLRIHQQLSEAADAWEAEDRDPSLVYRGSRLAIAQDWATGPGRTTQLSALEAAYLQTSIDQKHHEHHEHQRRARRLRTLVGVLAISLVIALLAGGIAFQQYNEADKRRRLATAAELTVASQSVAATHPDVAMLLAVEAYHLEPVSITRGALLSAQSQYFAGQLTGHTGPINKVVFSSDGSILATASSDGTVRLWDVASRHWITTLDSHTGPIHDADFSPDGRILATADGDGTVRLWNVSSHQLRATLPGVPGVILSAATFSHDGRILATATATAGVAGTVWLWDIANQRQIATLTGHTGPINKVVFSPNDRILATASDDSTVRLWDVADPHHTTPHPLGSPLRGHTGPVNAVVFSPDGNTLATASHDTTARLWNVTNPAQPTLLGPSLTGHTNASAVVFSPDGRLLVTGSGDGTARLWDIATHQTVGTLRGHNGPILGVAFSPDGHTVATAGEDTIARLWDTRGPILIPSPPAIDRNHGVEFSPDGRILAIASVDRTVRLWDVADPAHPTPLGQPLTGYTGTIYDMAFRRDGQILAAAGEDGVRLWDVASHQHITTLTGHTDAINKTDPINKAVFSPNGRILAAAGSDGTVRLWDVTDPVHPASMGQLLTGRTDGVFSVAFSPDGHTLVSGSDQTMRLWNITDPAHPTPLGQPLTGHIGPINKVLFSLDDRVLVTASDDGTAQQWELATGRLLNTLPITTLPGERSYPVAIGSNGHTLATTSGDDTTTKLWDWDVNSHQPIATLIGHTRPINTAAFSQDSHLLATTSEDGTVRLWDLDPDRVTTHLCRIIGTISPDQWAWLIPQLPDHQPTCH